MTGKIRFCPFGTLEALLVILRSKLYLFLFFHFVEQIYKRLVDGRSVVGHVFGRLFLQKVVGFNPTLGVRT